MLEPIGFQINWITVPIVLALTVALTLYAKHVSGGWTRPWMGIQPRWWFVLIFLVPWIGLPILLVRLMALRNTPGAVAGRRVSG